MHIDVFVHKADGLTADDKDEVFRNISSRLSQDLSDDTSNYQLHLTSIYDHTLFEAMSRVVQKIIPQLATLEALLDALVAKSRVAKAFLFDVVSKVFIATDSSPLDPQAYELCADMIDVVIDVSCIYGVSEGGEMPQAYDDQSCATIRLNNDHVLYLREVSKYLALVCLMHANSSFKIGLIDHNVAELKQSLVKVFEVPRKR
jgi:Ras-related GTP-binding protein C/D